MAEKEGSFPDFVMGKGLTTLSRSEKTRARTHTTEFQF